jgi:protein-tyrosine-phosphatase
LAEALLKKIRPDLEVDSAGVHPSIPISEEARKYLVRENAEEYLKVAPESLKNKKLENYDLIVVMERKHGEVVLSMCPECADKIVVWDIEDPYYFPPKYGEIIFEQIKQRITDLADSL